MSMAPGPSDPLGQAELEKDLRKLPPPVLEEFHRAREQISSVFNDEEINLWANEGLIIGNQTVRSWEAAVEYFRAGAGCSQVPAFSHLHAVGPLRNLPVPGLADAGGCLHEGEAQR